MLQKGQVSSVLQKGQVSVITGHLGSGESHMSVVERLGHKTQCGDMGDFVNV